MPGGLPGNFNGYHRADVAENARLWVQENCLRIANEQGKDAAELEQKALELLTSSAHGHQLRDKINPIFSYKEEPFATKLITHYREVLRLQGTQQPDQWYVHEELPIGDWIRTVKVLPKKDSTVRCDMHAIERSRAQFSCLSYEWVRNYKAETHIIELNGLPFRVRENLYDFLCLAQTDYPNEEFWIDAICIDQTNMKERNDQVSKMGETYSGKRVLAWLGNRKPEDRPLDPEVFRELEVFRERGEETHTLIREAYRVVREFWGWPGYWLRAWIVQEQQLASDVLLLLQDEQRTVAELEEIRKKGSEILEDFHPKGTPGYDIFYFTRSHFDQLEITSFLTQATKTDHDSPTDVSIDLKDQPFARILKSHRHVYCENWHDKIYALRALCSEGLRIQVDYAEDLRSLLIQVLSAPLRPFCLCFVRNLAKIYTLMPESPEIADMYVQSVFTFNGDEKRSITDLVRSNPSESLSHAIGLDKVCSNLTSELLLEKDAEGHLIAKMPWSDTALQACSRSNSSVMDDLALTVKIPVSALCLQYLTVFAARYDEVPCDVQNTVFIHPDTNLALQ